MAWKLFYDSTEWDGRCQDCKWFFSNDNGEPCCLCSGTATGDERIKRDCYFDAVEIDDERDVDKQYEVKCVVESKLYSVYIDDSCEATGMSMETALILAEAIMHKYYNEVGMKVTIVKEVRNPFEESGN